MSEQMQISLSQPDKFGQYRVRATSSNGEYMDFFNPATDARRRAFAENAILAFGWEERAEYVEEIMAAVLQALTRLERSDERLVPKSFSDMTGGGLEWLWPGRIAVGKVCVIAGDPGLGKSLLTIDIAARVSRGAAWPDESGIAPITSVYLLSAEDDYVDTIKPRLVAAGADFRHVFALTGVASGHGPAETERMVDIVNDLDRLRSALEKLPEPRLLVIDPISSFLGSAGENANAEIRRLLQPITILAQETRTAVLLVSHLRKSKGSNLHRIIGSIAFAAIARSAFVMQRVKGASPGSRRLVPVKNNLGAARTAIRFEVSQHPEHSHPHIVWGAEEPHEGVEIPADGRGRPKAISPEAEEALLNRLAEGPATASELMAVLGDLAPSMPSLLRYIRENCQWMEERRGRERLATLQEAATV